MCRTQLLEVLARVHRRIVRRLSPLFQERGLSPTEVMVLWGVYRRGSLRATELAGELGIPPSTFTGVFDRLVEKGLLRRVPDPEDRRGVRVEPTPALFPFMEEMRARAEEVLEDLLAPFPLSRIEALLKELKDLLACLE